MNCQAFQEHFCDLLYAKRGEPLEPDIAHGLREHLEHCAGCHREFRELEQAHTWLDALDDEPPASKTLLAPVDFYAAVARLQRSRSSWRSIACAVSALSALFFVAWLAGLWFAGEKQTGTETREPRGTSPLREYVSELRQLTERLAEQDQRLRFLAADLEFVEKRQTAIILNLDKRVTKLDKDADFQSLHLAALQRDIDQVRRFLTRSKDLTHISVP
jgi:hypothetical protein